MYYLCFVTCDLENSKVVQMAVCSGSLHSAVLDYSAVFKKNTPDLYCAKFDFFEGKF